MKLKQISQLLFAIFSIVTLGSCNDDSTTTTVGASADAQIYAFKLSATAVNAIDSVNYPIMAKTKFSIDQFRTLIYNPDSLPYKTKLKKFAASITYSSSGTYKLQLVYPDSIADWNGTDSIDFSTNPKIRVTAANGINTREYTINIRVHKVDPDTLIWNNIGSQPTTVGKQKTLLKDATFHTFSIDADGKLYLYKAAKSNTLTWAKQAVATGLTASSIDLGSITLFDNTFYAISNTKQAYSSTDGISWAALNDNVHAIFGILPAANASDDSLLVATKVDGKYYFATTVDMKDLNVVENISSDPLSNEIVGDFPASGFSSVTIYNRTNVNANMLTITGGNDFNGNSTNLTWSLRAGENKLEVISNQNNKLFSANMGISTFLYDGYLFALTKNVLYKTTSAGAKWVVAPSKEALDSNVPKAYGQSIIVDEENYIWIFGGMSSSGSIPVRQIWRGRLNHLIP
ncbi:hypothetical protein D0T84_07040 [Dysgonomonas sp. 521]|uniref:DUF6242 domain-containing protein n=1 Tax=Dysgonomonas sp. 521 TaxID=2302932 RepID=UPI0013D7F8F6|nr:DUF6242 domain-containing protein [Dysgonomonas sp. 521]NDV94674.1 hypothetical protein [Dysgonomonas sp. 521]